MAQKALNLRDLKVGDFVKVRRAGGYFNLVGTVTVIGFAKRNPPITVSFGDEVVIFQQKDLWLEKGPPPIVAMQDLPEILSMEEAAAMDEADIPFDLVSDDGSKASSSSVQSKMTDR